MSTDTELILKKLDEINSRLDRIENRVDSIEKRMDKNEEDHKKIFRMFEDNREEHNQIFEELHSISMTLTRIETEHEEKIKILFDGLEFYKERHKNLSAEIRRVGLKTDENSFRISKIETVLNQ